MYSLHHTLTPWRFGPTSERTTQLFIKCSQGALTLHKSPLNIPIEEGKAKKRPMRTKCSTRF